MNKMAVERDHLWIIPYSGVANNNLTKHKIPLNPNRVYSHLYVTLFISEKCSRPLQCHQGEYDGKGIVVENSLNWFLLKHFAFADLKKKKTFDDVNTILGLPTEPSKGPRQVEDLKAKLL